ncbi:MAG: hypothetical protein JWN01_910 [Patescibacteria group bacterium]|nr:hypothetical protein [Patescibacteria group bacterium]
MAYQDYDENSMDFNQPDLYAEDPYAGGNTGKDTFGERIEDPMMPEDEDALTEEELVELNQPRDEVEQGFGETLDANPHLDEQLEDRELNRQAEADYSENKDKSLLDKAKDKIESWTDSDK